MTNTVLYYTGPVDDMAQIMIKRQMKALFGGVNNTTTNNNVNNGSKKRKHSSLVDDNNNTELDDDGSSSLPSLELEDDAISELEDSVCSEVAERAKKRRKKLREFPSDLIVVLDMDECLIHFKAQQEQDDSNNNEEKENNIHNHNGVVQENSSLLYVNEHQVLLRPGLVEFLKFVTTRFQTHIFTAGTQEYADAILDQLSKLVVNHSNTTTTTTTSSQDIFCKRWYRDDCDTIDILNPLQVDRRGWCSIESIYVKPLSKVAVWAGRDGDDLSRIVHIDDQPKNFLLNYSNGISVKEWKGDCDCIGGVDQILQSVTKVLEKIDAKPDVRPHLRNESYLALKDHLDLLHLFPHRRTKGIGSTFLA